MQVWVVMSRVDPTEPWELGSVFATEEAAMQALSDYANDLEDEDPEGEFRVRLDADPDLSDPTDVIVGWMSEYGDVTAVVHRMEVQS